MYILVPYQVLPSGFLSRADREGQRVTDTVYEGPTPIRSSSRHKSRLSKDTGPRPLLPTSESGCWDSRFRSQSVGISTSNDFTISWSGLVRYYDKIHEMYTSEQIRKVVVSFDLDR